MNQPTIKNLLEFALLASGEPLGMKDFRLLLEDENIDQIRSALQELKNDWQARGLQLIETAGGYQFISREGYISHLRRLRPKKQTRLSRQLLEVLAIIAYRQPATRGDIEQLRGISVSSLQIAALEDLGWIEEVGRRETPGRPILYGTTQTFLNDLAIKSLTELPQLSQEEIDAVEQENAEQDNRDEEKPASGDDNTDNSANDSSNTPASDN